MFKAVKEAIQDRFNELAVNQSTVFYKDVDRDRIWEIYLGGFKEAARQEYNCNSCKSFLRQYSGIVFIIGGKVRSIWEIDLNTIDEELQGAIQAVQEYIASLPITNVFLADTKKLGNNKNIDSEGVTWEHFSLVTVLPITRTDDIASKKSVFRSTKDVFKRALEEITMDALDTVLELIAQNSLYKGKEFEKWIQDFRAVKVQYTNLADEDKDAFTWINSISSSTTNIRSSAVGTLLVNLSEGMELDEAVTKYEVITAPTNYKRPSALITPRMVEQAKQKIEELGFIDSLERRYANSTDINVENLLFIDKSSEMSDVFGDMAKEAVVNPKTLSKVEDITIADFIDKVLPTSKTVEVLLENKHFNNLVSLLTAQHPEAPSMFKWNNPFSWAYTGGITDSIKEKVKAAGGRIEGELRISLSWHNFDDLDLHVIEPNKNEIYYSRKNSTNGNGSLDVDMNAGGGHSREPVENVIFRNQGSMIEGEYTVIVNNFAAREMDNQGYEIEIECQGAIYSFGSVKSPSNKASDIVVKMKYTKANGLTITGNAEQKVSVREKWGVKTNQFTKVKSIMLSPNYWGQSTGNKHFLFMLEGCISDEQARPFFNEFLKQELHDNRKVFEVMAGKLKVPANSNQLSGVGFSETQSNSLIVRVTGAFKRTLKINI